MTAPGRDHRRSDVYDAEDEAFAHTILADRQPLAVLAAWAGDIQRAPWWQAHGPTRAVRVMAARSGARRSTFLASAGVVRLADDGCTLVTLLHEFAHALDVTSGRPETDAVHGPRFLRWEVDLLAAVVGPGFAGRLAAVLANYGLPVAPASEASSNRWAPVLDLASVTPPAVVGRPLAQPAPPRPPSAPIAL